MKSMLKIALATTAAFSGITAATEASAALTFNLAQVGGTVVVTGSGSVNTTGFPGSSGTANYSITINPSQGAVFVGDQTPTAAYIAITNPIAFGSLDNFFYPTSTSGSAFGIYGNQGYIMLPVGYVSGTALLGSATYTGSFASLGLNTGSYVFNLIGGDRVTVNIGSAVPETATWAMMIAGFGMMGAAMRSRRRTTKVSFA